MAQEILLQQENASATLIFGSIADAGASRKMTSTGVGVFTLDDFNRLLTQAKRNNPSWSGGSPERSRGVSDLIVSPEVVQSLREMAYNPVNTRNSSVSIDVTDAGTGKTMVPVPGGAGIAATDQMRNSLFSQAGLPEFYGISIMEIYEFGAGQKYTKVAKALTSHGRADQVLALDRSRDAMLRAVAVDAESGSTLTVSADDQYVGRSKKIGFYAELEEGRTVINDKAILQMGV
jgi:hypothetical protein